MGQTCCCSLQAQVPEVEVSIRAMKVLGEVPASVQVPEEGGSPASAEVHEEHGNPTRQGAMAGGHQICVHIKRGIGLDYLRHFNGHNSYCACEVQSSDGLVRAGRVETKALTSGNGNRFSPCWNEAWEIEGFWQGGELEFTIYDEGLAASGTEGRVVLPSDNIFPDGFSGMLPISGLKQAMLEVTVSVGR